MANKPIRPSRTPINGKRSVLDVKGKDPDYVYRIVNDDGDRVAQFQELGYEIVTDRSVKVGTRRVDNPTQEGTPVQVSVGGGMKAIVMRQKKEFYDEDQAAKAEAIAESERAMKREALKNADYGDIKIA
jgi:hypothetical protein